MKPILWTVSHSQLEEVWVLSTEEKCREFIKNNTETWEKFYLDPMGFTYTYAYIQDKALQDALREGMPELFL